VVLASVALAHADTPVPASAMSAQLVKTGLYLIEGGGSNTLVRFSASGLIIVDGKAPGMYRELMSQVRKLNRLSDLRVRVLILTSADEDRSGNLARFAAAGTPIAVQENAKRDLERNLNGEARAPSFVTYEREYSIRMGGVEARVLHVSPADGDGNSVVYFPNLKVVALGNLYRPVPAMDTASPGLNDWAKALAGVLELDFDLAVPSHGASVTRADVVALKAKIERLAADQPK